MTLALPAFNWRGVKPLVVEQTFLDRAAFDNPQLIRQ